MAGSSSRSGPERRRSARAALRLPIRLEGYLASGEPWRASSTTEDASAGGARFALDREVRVGHVVLLNLPMPRAMRDRDHWDANYRAYALVRHVERTGEASWAVGVMFYGKNPPRGFLESPGARFLLPRDVGSMAPEPEPPDEEETRDEPSGAAPSDEMPSGAAPSEAGAETRPPATPVDPDPGGQRTEQRYDIFVNLTLQEMDEFGVVLREEITVAENLSCNGARVMTSLRFAKGDVLILQEVDGGFACRAEVRHAWMGSDRIRRLNLKFLDGRQPLHLLPRN